MENLINILKTVTSSSSKIVRGTIIEKNSGGYLVDFGNESIVVPSTKTIKELPTRTEVLVDRTNSPIIIGDIQSRNYTITVYTVEG
jgi:ribosomal protein S1